MVHDLKLAALALLVAAASCTGPGAAARAARSARETAAPPAPSDAGAGVRLPLLPPGGGGPLVGAIGTLQVDGPCLYLRAPNGTRTFPVFAIADIRWNGADGVLEVGDRRFRRGETVTLGGAPAAALPRGVEWVQTLDLRCRAVNVFIAHAITAGG